MDRLSIGLTLMIGSSLASGFVVVALSLGLYGWLPIAAAVALGLFLTWPATYVISRWIKRDDPGWQPQAHARGGRDNHRPDFPET